MERRDKGNLGFVKAIGWFTEHGYDVYLPLFDNGPTDLIVEKDGSLSRVFVRYTSRLLRSGNYEVELRNVSRRKDNAVAVKFFDKTQYELLAIYVAPLDEIYLVEASNVNGKRSLTIPGRSAIGDAR